LVRYRFVLAAWAALALGLVAVSLAAAPATSALGPVIALVPPDQVTSDSFGFVNQVVNPTISGRGQAAAIEDLQTAAEFDVSQGGFVLLDTNGPDQMIPGLAMAVSGNGCAVVWARQGFIDTQGPFTSIGITERCRGFDGEFTKVGNGYTGNERMAVSELGRFAVYPAPASANFYPTLQRFDIDTLQVVELPNPVAPFKLSWRTDNGLDISADGNIVVAAGDFGNGIDAFVLDLGSGATRQLGANGVTNVTVSADGRFVAYDSIVAPSRRSVFVLDRATGATQLVSPAADNALMPSISGDGSQVAYAAGPACTLRSCAINRVDVAFSPVPGLTSGVQYETVSLDVNGRPAQGFEPDLTGNGRYVVFTSTQGGVLTGSTAISGLQAFVRERDGGLAINPNPVDFGTIGASTSLVQTATVTNTGRSSVIMDSIAISGSTRFTPAAGGTCVQGASLPPGASCTINVQFAAPGNTSTTTASLFVGETQFDPISATARLIGRSSFTPPPTTTTTLPPTTITTTTTTVVGQVSPTTTSTTTIPTFVQLDAQPNPVDFGAVAVGIPAPFQVITVTNLGTGSGLVTTEMLGANPDDFFVSDNQCSGATLGPGQSCTITVTMIAQDGGTRSAALTITSGGEGGDVALTGQGRFAPRMFSSPAAVTERGITTILGQGFPPGDSFTVRFLNTTTSIPVVADGQGMFRIPFTPLGKIELGAYVLQVDGVPGTFDDVKTQLVVVLPTFEPQGPGGPAFGEALIVTRGG
jgi:hypothetical protein